MAARRIFASESFEDILTKFSRYFHASDQLFTPKIFIIQRDHFYNKITSSNPSSETRLNIRYSDIRMNWNTRFEKESNFKFDDRRTFIFLWSFTFLCILLNACYIFPLL